MHTRAAAGEALIVATAGACLGWATGWLVHPVLAAALGATSAVNGAVSGWRGTYPWRSWRGWAAFLLDSTWATVPVAAGLLAHGVAVVRKGTYLPAVSRRRGQHVYRGGLALKAGFALTVGNVISGAGDLGRPSRVLLVEDHEAVHVWQGRLFGPLYLVLYGLWAAGGALAGLAVWWRRGRRPSAGAVVQTCSYYMNPFEWWAYSRQGFWRPSGMVDGVGWRRPMVRSFAARRMARRGEHPPRP